MRTLIAALTFTAFLVTPVAAQAPLKPEDFAYRGVVNLTETGPYHQVPLPLPVYKGLTSVDLADLRVFNGRGEVLPYALLSSEAQTVSQATETAAPHFPLFARRDAASGGGDLSVTVRQLADGKLVSIQENPAKVEGGAVVKGAVIDASSIKGSIRSLRLVTEASTEPFLGFSIESSRDLQHWRTLKRDAQLVHLEHGGHRVDSDTVEWDSAADRYLRLTWDNPQRAPQIVQVMLGTVETRFTPPMRVWSEAIAPTVTKSGVFDYAWTGQLPLERLRINLPQVNTLTPLAVQRQFRRYGKHRAFEDAPQRWEDITQTVVYRLQTAQKEIRSPDIALAAPEINRLRLEVDVRGGSIGSQPPTVQIGFVPHVLVFLARGEGPFTLAWGAEGMERADLPFSTLLPGGEEAGTLKAAPATLAEAQIVQGKPVASAAKPEAEAPSSPATKWILWAVLLVGVLVLGGMARSLTQQLRQPPNPEP